MYSRKFNGVGVLPPDYSGVALRESSKEQLRRCPPPDEEVCRPRHPVFEKDPLDMPDTYPVKEQIPCTEKEHQTQKDSCRSDREAFGRNLPFSGRNFSLEDIILAGLLLLIMNDEESETDSGLLIILGLLLLTGI